MRVCTLGVATPPPFGDKPVDLIYLLMIIWAAFMVVGIIIALLPVILFICGVVLCLLVIGAIASTIGFAFH